MTERNEVFRLAKDCLWAADRSVNASDILRNASLMLLTLLAENESLKEQATKDAENISLKADFIEAMLNQIAPGEPENRGEDK